MERQECGGRFGEDLPGERRRLAAGRSELHELAPVVIRVGGALHQPAAYELSTMTVA